MSVAAACCHAAVTRDPLTPECDECHVTAPSAITNTCGDSWRMPKRDAMASESGRSRWTTTSSTGAGNAPSTSDARAMWLMPHVWLCLKRMMGVVRERARAASRSAADVSGWNTVTRRLYCAVVAGMLAAAPAPAAAQPALTPGTTEWSVTAGVARGIAVLESRGGQRYATFQLAWGRVLTDLRGPAWFRGRFEWSMEVVPAFAEWSAGEARGAGVSPLGWRWNLEPRGHVAPFVEVGGGALWTTAPIPQGTTGSNFTSYAGVGIRVLRAGRHGLIASYRLHHISNGNRLRRNPGVNAHMLTLGWTRLDAR